MSEAVEMKVNPMEPMDVDGLSLTFRDLSYAVDIKKTKEVPAHQKQILQGLSGACKAGRLLAIMGPSGAGKTSLLDILAGRKCHSSGQICLGANSHTKPSDIAKQAAYVQQDDAIMASQTVREAIQMAALLTLPASQPYATKIQKAEHLLELFHLTNCADTVVGDPVGTVKGISGGERKRCAVAMNAVREPRIIFLDEPTSGLDAHKAFVLIKLLKELAADRAATVVCTIHQPSSDIFGLFDDLHLLLSGTTVFNGKAAEAVQHFASAGFPCPQYANPCDYFFMHVLVSPDGSAADDSRIKDLTSAWKESQLQSEMDLEVSTTFKLIQEAMTPASAKTAASMLPAPRASMGLQFQVLLSRSFKDMKRNPMRGKAQVGQAVAFAVIISLIWFQVGTDQNGVQDRSGVLFFMTANGMMNNIMGVLTTFANERGAVLREQENNMYDTLPYFLSRVFVDVPLKIFCPVLFGTIAYWSVGLKQTADAYLMCLTILALLALCGNGIGLFLACIFPDVAVALLVAPMIILPLMMFSGFFLNADSTPVYFKWIEYISPMKYSFTALAENEFTGLRLHCTDDQLRSMPLSDGSFLKICPMEHGEDFLESLNIQEFLSIETCCLLLAIEAMVFTILAFLGLLFISRRSRAKSQASKTAVESK
mmetsp:Transcript_50052/g.89833  ORF Transcript_50052/g.89833 Transcript_50052/m.89833 type:complete len:652 (-) Transcript_50052:66-2021(-)